MSDPIKQTGKHAWKLRNKIKQAAHEGVTIHEYLQDDAELEQSIEDAGKIWLKGRHGHQFHIGNVVLFNNRDGKRWLLLMCILKLVHGLGECVADGTCSIIFRRSYFFKNSCVSGIEASLYKEPPGRYSFFMCCFITFSM